MPRGRKKKILSGDEKASPITLDKNEVLRQAKNLGLFNKNKKYKTYDIILTQDEYEKI